MCTVSYVPTNNGFILTSSRDEKMTRPAAQIADPVMFHDMEVTFPKDPLGQGSWIASSKHRTVCLLNGAFTAHQPRPPYRHSRGLVVLDAFNYFSIRSFAASYHFQGLEPFTLLLAEADSLLVLRWNGQQLFEFEKDPESPHIWSSSTLYTSAIMEQRERWFEKWLDSANERSLESIRDFHKTAGEGDPENAIVMRRANQYATVSLTSVVRSGTQMEMIYEDLIHQQITHKTLSPAYASN